MGSQRSAFSEVLSRKTQVVCSIKRVGLLDADSVVARLRGRWRVETMMYDAIGWKDKDRSRDEVDVSRSRSHYLFLRTDPTRGDL